MALNDLLETLNTTPVYDLFISHRSADNILAKKVFDTVKALHPEWNVFFDEDGCLEQGRGDYLDEIFKALSKTVKLIWVASKQELTEFGSGYLYAEVDKFYRLMNSGRKPGYNVDYYGIILDNVDENGLAEIYTAREIIKVKNVDSINEDRIKNLLDGTYSAITFRKNIRKKSSAFADEMQKLNKKFSLNYIDEMLIPHLRCRDSDENNSLDFNGLLSLLQEKDAVVVADEGGAGKTTLLTKVFYYYLNKDDAFTPIYIELNTIPRHVNDNLILRYVIKELYKQPEVMSVADGNLPGIISTLANNFREQNDGKDYLLVIDGLNEITKRQADLIIKECSLYHNVRVLISSRKIDENKFSDYAILNLNKLTKNVIQSKVKTEESNDLLDILAVPMYLKIYLDSDIKGEVVKTKGELLEKYFDWQKKKNANNEKIYESNKFLIDFILTSVAFYMVKNNLRNINNDELKSIVSDALNKAPANFGEKNYLFSSCYREYYKRNKYNTHYIGSFRVEDSWDLEELIDKIMDFFFNDFGILRTNIDRNIEFIHQNYRDFLCAKFLSREIELSKDDSYIPYGISQKIFDEEILDFVSDILGEYNLVPFCDHDNEIWNYTCNEKSLTYKTLNKFRNTDNAVAPANLLTILSHSRRGDLSNGDYSHLNLTKCQLNSRIFYRFYGNKNFVSNFDYSKINKENMLADNYSKATAFAVYENFIAIFDENKSIKLWDMNHEMPFPMLYIEEVSLEIKQMLFVDATTLLVSSDYDIALINLNSEQLEIIFTSKYMIKNIFYSDGKIQFNTLFQPFEIQSIEPCEACISKTPLLSFSANVEFSPSKNIVAFRSFGKGGHLNIAFYDQDNKTWKIDERINFEAYFKGGPHFFAFKNENTLIIEEQKIFYEYDINQKLENRVLIPKMKVVGTYLKSKYENGLLVVVTGNNSLYVYNDNYEMIFDKKMPMTFISHFIPYNSGFLIQYQNTIYEFNSDLNCIKSIKTKRATKTVNVLSTNIQNKKICLLNKNNWTVLDTGEIGLEVDIDNFVITQEPEIRIVAETSYKRNRNLLYAINSKDGSIKKLKLKNELIINGCSFKGITGSLSNCEYLELLKTYGAEY